MKPLFSPLVRRLVLGGALLLATLVVILPDPPAVGATVPGSSAAIVVAQGDARTSPESTREATQAAQDAAREARQAAREAAREAKEAAREARRQAAGGNDGMEDGNRRIGPKGAKIAIYQDDEFDSFQQFLDHDPRVASGVLGIVFIVFLTPILFVGLIIWYKLRKNRMQNEAMLKLAEKGLIPPGEAMQAIGDGRAEAAMNLAVATAPLSEQARMLRKRAAWSDLRKGVLMGAAGFALSAWSVVDDHSLNPVGMVLLFVGIGFIVLWYFEDRHASATVAPNRSTPVPGMGPGDPGN